MIVFSNSKALIATHGIVPALKNSNLMPKLKVKYAEIRVLWQPGGSGSTWSSGNQFLSDHCS